MTDPNRVEAAVRWHWRWTRELWPRPTEAGEKSAERSAAALYREESLEWVESVIERARVPPSASLVPYTSEASTLLPYSARSLPSFRLYRVVQYTAAHNPIHALATSADNRQLSVGCTDGTIGLIDMATGQRISTLVSDRQLRGSVQCLAYAPHAPQILYSGGGDKRVLQWDARIGRITQRLVGHTAGVYALAVHPLLAPVIVSGGGDATVRVWDARATGDACVHALAGHAAAVRSLEVREQEPQILSGSDDATMRWWQLTPRAQLAGVYARHAHGLCRVQRCWLEVTGEEHEEEMEAVVSAAGDGVCLWRLPDGQCLARGAWVHHREGAATALRDRRMVSAEARDVDGLVAAADAYGQVWLWHWTQPRWTPLERQPAGDEQCVDRVLFDRSTSRLIVGDRAGRLRWYREEEPER
ncbi:hypothetical protein CDCA_CDCA14G3916 [Cyanidium caldarium]|uniref:Uncharacterized protein n=1 Tax=Cyanidium caldarium TaxID=2771 RepID=A0AAV9J0H8_CYACA|nr:hypothetical protein CDCA_CDCA14G3916 [Cyanidium caldarium]